MGKIKSGGREFETNGSTKNSSGSEVRTFAGEANDTGKTQP